MQLQIIVLIFEPVSVSFRLRVYPRLLKCGMAGSKEVALHRGFEKHTSPPRDWGVPCPYQKQARLTATDGMLSPL